MSHPTEPFETQNVRDDDGSVIDSFFIETDNPPSLKELNEPIIVKHLVEPAPITRLLTADLVLAPDWAPTLVVPADKNRKSLNVYVYSPTGVTTDGIRFSDDIGGVRTAGKILHNGTIDFSNHTGPLYALPCATNSPTASAFIAVQFWSVTS